MYVSVLLSMSKFGERIKHAFTLNSLINRDSKAQK